MTEDRAAILRDIDATYQALARQGLLDFACYTNPTYEPNWHHAAIAAALDDVLSGKTKRLMVFVPPQNGKSELVSRKFPAYVLGRQPDWPILHVSYGAELATEMSRDVQRTMDSDEYKRLFPGTKLATNRDEEVRMAAQFRVVGRQGSYRASGVGGSITGKSMMLGIIDDPIKRRDEAESEAYRRAVWNTYVADFSTRQIGDAARIVLVQTRWHTDDLAGRLLEMAKKHPETPQWRVISFPAILEQETPGDPRKVGDALWPQRFSKDWLGGVKTSSGAYDWASLYQQSPVPAGGGMAQRAWFAKVSETPRGGVRRRVRAWDLAATKETPGREPAWTVGTKLAQHVDGTFTVEHVVRVRESPRTVDDIMRSTAYGDGRDCLIREWQDPGQAGKSVVDAHLRMLAGYDYAAVRASGEKTMQWRPFLVQAEAGNVWLLAGPWNEAWVDEMAMVPYTTFLDQADSVSLGFNELTAFRDLGPQAGVILPGTQTVGGPEIGAWRDAYFRR